MINELNTNNNLYGQLWPHDSNTQFSDLDALPLRHGISNIEILFQFNCQTRNFIHIVLLKTDWALCPCGKRKKIKKDFELCLCQLFGKTEGIKLVSRKISKTSFVKGYGTQRVRQRRQLKNWDFPLGVQSEILVGYNHNR